MKEEDEVEVGRRQSVCLYLRPEDVLLAGAVPLDAVALAAHLRSRDGDVGPHRRLEPDPLPLSRELAAGGRAREGEGAACNEKKGEKSMNDGQSFSCWRSKNVIFSQR